VKKKIKLEGKYSYGFLAEVMADLGVQNSFCHGARSATGQQLLTVTLEGGGADKLWQKFKFGIYPHNYFNPCDSPAWRGPEPRDRPS
jgi:hypothetical protein